MGYGTVSRILHWLTVLLVLGLFPAGLIMTSGVDRTIQNPLFIAHKSAGALLLLILLFRVFWALTHRPSPLPDSLSAVQKLAAHATHLGLYVFLVIMVVSGYVRVTAGGFPIDLFDALHIPPLVPRSDSVAAAAKAIHAIAKYGLALLVVMHVGAAAVHGLVLRDGVFSRMWPPFRQPQR
jgi:cytochrome b561